MRMSLYVHVALRRGEETPPARFTPDLGSRNGAPELDPEPPTPHLSGLSLVLRDLLWAEQSRPLLFADKAHSSEERCCGEVCFVL